MTVLRIIAITVVALTCLLVSACGANSPTAQPASTTNPTALRPDARQTTRIPIAANPTDMQPQPQAAQSEYATISSLKERIAKSSVIIQGEITGQGEIINGDRNTSDPTKPASNAFSIGQVYHVRVIRYLKGTGSQTLNIIQVEGVIRREPTAVTRQDIEQARTSYPYLPFQTGTTYMLFLDPFVGTDFTGTYYIGGGGVASPWRFALLPDGTLNAEGPGIGSLAQPGGEFAPRPLADFTAQVTQFVQAEKAATPPK